MLRGCRVDIIFELIDQLILLLLHWDLNSLNLQGGQSVSFQSEITFLSNPLRQNAFLLILNQCYKCFLFYPQALFSMKQESIFHFNAMLLQTCNQCGKTLLTLSELSDQQDQKHCLLIYIRSPTMRNSMFFHKLYLCEYLMSMTSPAFLLVRSFVPTCNITTAHQI